MLTQRDTLRRLAGAPGVFMTGGVHDLAASPMRILRSIACYPDGTTVKLAYDETLELQAIVTSGLTPVAVTVWKHATPGTKHTLQSGTGNREFALPSTNAGRVRARRVSQNCPRWNDIAFQIQTG